MQVGIIGLGYVGRPLFRLLEEQGHDVVGYDTDTAVIRDMDTDQVSDDPGVLADRACYIITVPTPVDERTPDYRHVEDAARTIATHLDPGDLVVLESTVAPGSCREIVAPLLEEDGLTVGEDVFLAHCPERIDPGNDDWGLADIPRVLGAMSEDGLQAAGRFYADVLDADVHTTDSIDVAEASKVTENAFRDINIAFVNEIAQICDQIGIPATAVIDAASTKPFGFMAHQPGCGVGGHCVPVDPYYLIQESEQRGHEPELLSTARDINDTMPEYTVQKVMEGLNEIGEAVQGSTIVVLGLAYKGGVDDTRMSPALTITDRLEELGADVISVDPHVPAADHDRLADAPDADCIVLATDHAAFTGISPPSDAVLIDGRNQLGHLRDAVAVYRSVGGPDQ